MRDKIDRFFALTGIDKFPEVIALGYAEQIREQFPNIPDEQLPDELKTALGVMRTAIFVHKTDLHERIVKLYESTYTAREFDELIAFFESPVGRKVVENQGVVLPGVGQIGDLWTNDVMKSIEPELSRLLMGNIKTGGATGESSTEPMSGVRH